MLSVFHQLPSKIQTITEAVIILHNPMHLHAPHIQNKEVDTEDQCHKIIRGAWHQAFEQEDIDAPLPIWYNNGAGKRQGLYLEHYFNDPDRGAVPWQVDMVQLHRT